MGDLRDRTQPWGTVALKQSTETGFMKITVANSLQGLGKTSSGKHGGKILQYYHWEVMTRWEGKSVDALSKCW